MANHRTFAMTFQALAADTPYTNGGFTYERTSKDGSELIQCTPKIPYACSLDSEGRAVFAGEDEAIIGAPENLESDMRLAVMTSGVVEFPIGNAESGGAARTVTVGEPVVGAQGSAVGVADGDVTSSTQRRGFVKGIDRTIADIGSTVNQANVNTVVADLETALRDIARGARAICIGTRTAAESETRNGTAVVMLL